MVMPPEVLPADGEGLQVALETILNDALFGRKQVAKALRSLVSSAPDDLFPC
jgi:hypothetical protein